MEAINTWWEGDPGERFWLGIAGRDSDHDLDVLAAPGGKGHRGASVAPLITHVKAGDAVFHYDEARQAIVAWSTALGRVQRREQVWSGRVPPPGADPVEHIARPGWAITLEHPTALDPIVPIGEIARVQWELFPALRAFEDRVGEPLYYPFAMGSPSDTRLLAGHVFKLPAMFIERFAPLKQVAEQMRWVLDARTRISDREAPQPASSRLAADRRDRPSTARDPALGMR